MPWFRLSLAGAGARCEARRFEPRQQLTLGILRALPFRGGKHSMYIGIGTLILIIILLVILF
jgi:hypothetical protein